MPLTIEQRQEQVRQAEEILFRPDESIGFARALFFGHFQAEAVFPYPRLDPEEAQVLASLLDGVRRFAEEEIDPFAIDREADIPRKVIRGLGQLGILGMTVPRAYGGLGLSQKAYSRVMEIIGARDASVAVFINAHHSIGLRGIVLAGSEAQKQHWLPRLCRGEALAAFALTEPEAGSDAANVQTSATPTEDGQHYVVNGEKRYITNGAIADVLTVMARTPVPGKETTQVTAFLVTPDMPGFEVVEARMPKCGIRGTATARLRFRNMRVPAANLLGELGKGLKLALSVIDYGRTTFGASCTGAAKVCVRAATQHARTRKQFGQTLGEFEMVKEKLAWMAAHSLAMEAMTFHCAHLIDTGAPDYMVETAMLKVFASEALWRIVNDTIQIFGGQAYFSNEPYERMMRDARINLIGEGANDVLRAFIALVGIRNVGLSLKGVLDALYRPWGQLGTLWRFGRRQIRQYLWAPAVPVRSGALQAEASDLGRRVQEFGRAVEAVLRRYREETLERQYVQKRLADAAIDLYASACVLSRLDALLTEASSQPPAQHDHMLSIGRYFLRLASRRIGTRLAQLWDNEDQKATQVADALQEANVSTLFDPGS